VDPRCTSRERIVAASGRTLRRYAGFYPPAPPAALVWPADTGTALMENGCLLGLIWTEVSVQDTAQGARLADSIEELITSAVGARLRDANISYAGSAYWSHRAAWRWGSAFIVLAVDRSSESVEEGRTSTSVLTFAFLPVSGLALDDLAEREGRDILGDSLPLARAVALSGVKVGAWAPLRSVLDAKTELDAERRGDAQMPPASALVASLGGWLHAAEGLPPERRAAALFVADLALDRTRCAVHLCGQGDSAKLEPLRALGAEFVYSELGGGWEYTNNWLVQARTLGGDGPVGDAAFMILLKRGFNLSGMCDAGSDGFRKVIAEGEAFLGRRGSAPVAAAVHFLVAEAYSDIVALARGDGAEYADSTAYQAEAPGAARSALAHYRAVINAGDTTALARAAWTRAFRLLAGAPSMGTAFFCVYD
jgi:hypothetical protein